MKNHYGDGLAAVRVFDVYVAMCLKTYSHGKESVLRIMQPLALVSNVMHTFFSKREN